MAPTSKGASLYLYWILSSAAIVLTSAPVALGGGGACVELGFSSSLLCSSCDELRQFSLNALEDDCKKCCQTEGSTGVNKVCMCYAPNNCTMLIHLYRSTQAL